jgi:hypothetical protein
MLHSRSANWNTLKLAAAAAAVAVLSGCAVAVPLQPVITAWQDSRDRDFTCKTYPKCTKPIVSNQRTSRSSQPVGGGNVVDDPPDFILNSPEGMLH